MRHRTAILLAIEAFASGRGATESVAVTHPSHQPIQLAVTIDDRPWVGRVHEGETWLSASPRLLATLKRRGTVPRDAAFSASVHARRRPSAIQSALTGEANGVRIETDAGIGSTCWTVVLHPRIAGDKPERPLARHRVRLTPRERRY